MTFYVALTISWQTRYVLWRDKLLDADNKNAKDYLVTTKKKQNEKNLITAISTKDLTYTSNTSNSTSAASTSSSSVASPANSNSKADFYNFENSSSCSSILNFQQVNAVKNEIKITSN